MLDMSPTASPTTTAPASMTLPDLQARAYHDSAVWFPAVHESAAHEVEHFAAGLIGELGELCELLPRRGTGLDHVINTMVALGRVANDLKKRNRATGFLDPADVDIIGLLAALRFAVTEHPEPWTPDPTAEADRSAELADCAIYLLDLAAALGIDLAAAIETKRAVLIERWGDPAADLEHDTGPSGCCPDPASRTMPSDHVEIIQGLHLLDPNYRAWCRTCGAWVSDRTPEKRLANQSGDLHAETVHGAGH